MSRDVISLKAYVPGSDDSAFEGFRMFRRWRTGLALMSVMVGQLEGVSKGQNRRVGDEGPARRLAPRLKEVSDLEH